MSIHTDTNRKIDYFPWDSNLPFNEYINKTREWIEKNRPDLQHANEKHTLILDANSPFEFYPQTPLSKKTGILCLHGLLDSPFSWREPAAIFSESGAICKSVLLPGHGTRPEDLLAVSYENWIAAMRYGIANLRKEVDHLFIAGYSTGGALAIWQALQDQNLAGIILFAPALEIKAPSLMLQGLRYLKKILPAKHPQWINKKQEIDYVKYVSVPFNAVQQVYNLIEKINALRTHHTINCPIFICVTAEDETVSASHALEFFQDGKNKKSRGILYAENALSYPDERIIVRPTHYPEWHIKQISHICMPFSPRNLHYGQQGDHPLASHITENNLIYGAYDPLYLDMRNYLFKQGIGQNRISALTYQPDFDFMMKNVQQFILDVVTNAQTS